MQYILKNGGIMIYPLILTSIIALTLIIERFITFFSISKKIFDRDINQIKGCLADNKIDDALNICQKVKGPIGKILQQGITNYIKAPGEIKELMEEVKWDVFPTLERNLESLHFIGKITPTLGLLGTVTGMIKTFHVLSLNGEPQQLAGGISEALLTTAVGLIISIPALGAYYYFNNKIQQIVNHTEKREIELINWLKENINNKRNEQL